MLSKIASAAALIAPLMLAAAPAAAVPVAVELALLVDVSGSVSASSYALQKNGYINAFRNSAFHTSLASMSGGLAITYIEWASRNEQKQQVNWFHVYDATSANAFADLIGSTTRAYTGNTAVGNALKYVTPMFNSNSFEGQRWIIDVSGDGTDNHSDIATATARDQALAAGVDAINGLTIVGGVTLENWYKANVQGGTGQVRAASSFADFQTVVLDHIIADTKEVPEPASLALLAAGIAGLRLARRRKA